MSIMIRCGNWMLTNCAAGNQRIGLFRLTETQSIGNSKNSWQVWTRVL